jgi:hypothetical protein
MLRCHFGVCWTVKPPLPRFVRREPAHPAVQDTATAREGTVHERYTPDLLRIALVPDADAETGMIGAVLVDVAWPDLADPMDVYRHEASG